MRKILPFLGLFALVSFSFSDFTENRVTETATNQLAVWLAKIPVGQESHFGFTNREEFNSAQISKPYRTISFTNDYFTDQKSGEKNYIIYQNEWRVPVAVNNENRVLLTIYGRDSILNVVDMGGTVLAKELQQRTTTGNSGNNYILRIYQLGADILVHTNEGQEVSEGIFIPMTSALMSMETLKTKSSFSQAEILQIVKQKLQEKSKN